MTDDYTPLTDEQVRAMGDFYDPENRTKWIDPQAAKMDIHALLADREHYKRRAETAERLLGLVAPHACVITRHAMPSARPMAGGQVQG